MLRVADLDGLALQRFPRAVNITSPVVQVIIDAADTAQTADGQIDVFEMTRVKLSMFLRHP